MNMYWLWILFKNVLKSLWVFKSLLVWGIQEMAVILFYSLDVYWLMSLIQFYVQGRSVCSLCYSRSFYLMLIDCILIFFLIFLSIAEISYFLLFWLVWFLKHIDFLYDLNSFFRIPFYQFLAFQDSLNMFLYVFWIFVGCSGIL